MADEVPGAGWTNGSLRSQSDLVSQYSRNRRWIHPASTSSWSRTGDGSTAGGSSASTSEEDGSAIRAVMAQLCEQFYRLKWCTGTGGGMSIRSGASVFCTPSGLQKEDMIGADMFELDLATRRPLSAPPNNLKLSAMTDLWFLVYRHRPAARCVIHTHSMFAQLATLTTCSHSLKLTHFEMIKGVGQHAYDDTLEIPIIENRPTEDLLAPDMEQALLQYPKCNAVLVRRHGVYCWGDCWEQAKTQLESFDYLFETAVRMKHMGLDCAAAPLADADITTYKRKRLDHPLTTTAAATGFNASVHLDNAADLTRTSNTIPMLPRDAKVLLLDIEGCTTSISFVKDVLFPYVKNHLSSYLGQLEGDELRSVLSALRHDVQTLDANHPLHSEIDLSPLCTGVQPVDAVAAKNRIETLVYEMMRNDVKATGLKALQGQMWKAGYESGELLGHVYPDVPFLFQWCRQHSLSVSIYSSGSIGAQRLLFEHSNRGDLRPYIHAYFDTTSGGKKDAVSYQTIANSLNVPVTDIVFVSDAQEELMAARDANIGFPIMSVRPGNAPLTDIGRTFPIIHSLLQICGT